MANQYIEAPAEEIILNNQSLYLAGGITGCEDWRKYVVKQLNASLDDLTIINPKRDQYSTYKEVSGYSEAEKQIAWEYDYQRMSRQILFWFNSETLQPISLFELGNALCKSKIGIKQQIFLGVDPNYARTFDLQVLSRLHRYEGIIAESLDQLVQSIIIYNRNLQVFKGEE